MSATSIGLFGMATLVATFLDKAEAKTPKSKAFYEQLRAAVGKGQ